MKSSSGAMREISTLAISWGRADAAIVSS